ncbi:MAG: DUF4203 domain-containing protein [Acidobacteriota bacterium]
METFLNHVTATDLVAIGLGLALLVLGRRLFWLALAGVGFLAAVVLTRQLLADAAPLVQLALALGAGLLGAFVAVTAQRLALSFGGFVVGAFGAAWGLQTFAPDLGNWILPAALVAGVLGVLLAHSLFEVALVVVSSGAGAALVAGASGLTPPKDLWLAVGLFVVGLVAQSGGDKAPRRKSD